MHLVVELAARREAMVHREAVVACHHAAFVVYTRNAPNPPPDGDTPSGGSSTKRVDPARAGPCRAPPVLVPRAGSGKRGRGGPGGDGAGSRPWSEADARQP